MEIRTASDESMVVPLDVADSDSVVRLMPFLIHFTRSLANVMRRRRGRREKVKRK
jgi:hypothetical protein